MFKLKRSLFLILCLVFVLLVLFSFAVLIIMTARYFSGSPIYMYVK